ncbi:hypothetical protein LFM09_38415 [Lentzea alba]|uniref:hypothetical protein n=1 Tax=Lentzea alba TaxID=2714351 RepID=UPI0039BEF69F
MTMNSSRGSGGFCDIRDGAQVEIVDQDNKVLGVSSLNTANGSCVITFTVRDIPAGESLCGVLSKTQEEAVAEGFHLTLG